MYEIMMIPAHSNVNVAHMCRMGIKERIQWAHVCPFVRLKESTPEEEAGIDAAVVVAIRDINDDY